MLNESDRFLPNTAEVASSVIDGEALLINLSTGVYYSLENVGARVWQYLEAQCSLGEIVASLCAQYVVTRDRVSREVTKLLEELIAEGLITIDQSNSQKEFGPEKVVSGAEYETPALNIYRDMGDLLALDAPMPNLDDLPRKPGV